MPGWSRPVSTRCTTTEPLGFGANINLGVALTTAELVVAANPDAVPAQDAVAALREFMVELRAAGSPARGWCSPTGSGSRRGAAFRPFRHDRPPDAVAPVVPQRHHFHLDEPPPDEPVEADWMLGGFLMLRRAMLQELGGFDEGFRLYGEDIDLAYRATRRLGALVRARRGGPPRAQGGDRQALVHAADPVALGRHPPLRAQAPGAVAGALTLERSSRREREHSSTEMPVVPRPM